MATIGTFNEEGANVDLYIPRKCHATNSLISSYDYSSVQIVIANVDANGTIDGTNTTLCICGRIRSQGESDHAINHIAIERGIIRIKTAKPKKVKKTKKSAQQKSAAKPQQGKPGQRQQNAKPGQRQQNAKPGQRQQQQGRKPAAGQRAAAPQQKAAAGKPQGRQQAPRRA